MRIRRFITARALRRVRAFTLLEIGIVLSIVGILSSTAGVHYLLMLDRARMTRAIVELRGIAAELDPMGDDGSQLPGTLAEAGIDRRDPWGRPYQYLLLEGELPPGMASNAAGLPAVAAPPEGGGGGQPGIALARKDRFLVPINSDYDLYSVGPDGLTHASVNHKDSRDDIIRAADGAFYGLAEKF